MREFFLDPRTRRTDCLNGYGIQWRSFTECYLDSTGTFRDAIISIRGTRTDAGRSKHRSINTRAQPQNAEQGHPPLVIR
jgi:hypothetical protein